MSDQARITDVPPQRLCCEIQLFELCDLCSCNERRGRFCANPDLLSRFEKIAEDELRPTERYLSEVNDDDDDDEEEEEEEEEAYDDYSYEEDDGGDGDDGDAGWELEE